MGSELIKTNQNTAVSIIQHTDLGDIIKPLIREIHLFDTYIAGTTHLKDKSILQAIKVDDKLSLQREDNEYDKNAILVLNAEKKKLGYVPEKDNISRSSFSSIRANWRNSLGFKNLGIPAREPATSSS